MSSFRIRICFSAASARVPDFVSISHPITAEKHKSRLGGCQDRLEDGAGRPGSTHRDIVCLHEHCKAAGDDVGPEGTDGVAQPALVLVENQQIGLMTGRLEHRREHADPGVLVEDVLNEEHSGHGDLSLSARSGIAGRRSGAFKSAADLATEPQLPDAGGTSSIVTRPVSPSTVTT